MPDLNTSVLKAFGETVILPDASEVLGIFDIPTEMADLARFRLKVSRPVVTLLDTDAAALSINDTITLRGQVYAVAKILPDGQGMTILHLAENASTGTGNWR